MPRRDGTEAGRRASKRLMTTLIVRVALFSSVLAGLCHAACAGGPALRADVGPAERVVYSSRGDNSVTVADAATLEQVTKIEVGLGAHELAVSADGRLAIGSAYGGPGAGHQPADKRLCVVDLESGTLKHTIDLGDAQRPNDIAFIGPGVAAVTVEMPPHVFIVDAEKGRVVERIPLEHKTGHMLAVSPDGRTAYVAHIAPGLVSVVDLAAGKVVTTITTAFGSEGIAISPDGATLWVANNRSGSVSVIDTATREVVETFPVEGFPFRLRFSPDGSKVAISCPASGDVAFFDAKSRELVTRVPVGEEGKPNPQPTSIAFSERGASLAVLCAGTGEVVRLDMTTWKPTARASAGPIADALAAYRVPA